MAAEQSEPNGPDLTQGIAIDAIADGDMIGGRVGARVLRHRSDLFALWRTARRRPGGWRHGALSLASCAF